MMRPIRIRSSGDFQLPALLEIRDLRTHFHLEEGIVKAVDGVSLVVAREKTLGVVGESGCGKSVTARSILRIVPRPGRIVGGQIVLDRGNGAGTDLVGLAPDGVEMRRIRGREIAMIFQEPMTSLSPVHTVGDQIAEAVRLHQRMKRREARASAIDMLGRVGIPRPGRLVDEYPHRLSGGLRQRAMIAMALSCGPRLLIADEPTTALDVTIQAQILDLLRQLRTDLGMAIMLITHDLGVIAEMADEVVVMYMGRVVEAAPVRALFRSPHHPYTRGLIESIPKVGRRVPRLPSIQGGVPDAFDLPPGCPFHPRCPEAIVGQCDMGEPPGLIRTGEDHQVACVLYERDLRHA